MKQGKHDPFLRRMAHASDQSGQSPQLSTPLNEEKVMCVHNTEEDKVSLLLSPNEPLERQYSGMG